MNFLEGLKRVFLLFTILAAIIGGGMGWSDGAPPRWCSDPIVWDNGVMKTPGPWQNYQEPKPFNSTADDPCGPAYQAAGKRVIYAVVYAAIGAAIMLAIWLTLRWIIIGFFPAAARKP